MLDCKFYIERQKQTNILFTNTNNIVSHSCYSYSFLDFFFLSWNSLRGKKKSFFEEAKPKSWKGRKWTYPNQIYMYQYINK